MKVLFDTDLASAFAKARRLELLVRLFAGIDLGIAFEVYFAVCDRKAIAYARSLGVTTFALRVILRLLWMRHIISQEEVRALIQELWEKDKLVIVDPEEIFHE